MTDGFIMEESGASLYGIICCFWGRFHRIGSSTEKGIFIQ